MYIHVINARYLKWLSTKYSSNGNSNRKCINLTQDANLILQYACQIKKKPICQNIYFVIIDSFYKSKSIFTCQF